MSRDALAGLLHRCLICQLPVALHGICNGCYETGARLTVADAVTPADPHKAAEAGLAHWRTLHATGSCPDCDNTPACTCEIAEPLIESRRGQCFDCGCLAEGSICRDCLMQRGA